MDDGKHLVAVKALSDLIESEAASGDPGRFVRVARLCRLAQSLSRENGKRVRDFGGIGRGAIIGPDIIDFGMEDDNEAVGVPMPGGPADMAGLVRDMTRGMLNKPSERSAEIVDLLRCRDLLTPEEDDLRTLISARVRKLVSALGQQKEDEHADVVPAEPFRGHRSEIDREEEDGSQLQGALPPGAHRDGGAAEEGGVAGGDAGPVG